MEFARHGFERMRLTLERRAFVILKPPFVVLRKQVLCLEDHYLRTEVS
jgi:hypothetical protein